MDAYVGQHHIFKHACKRTHVKTVENRVTAVVQFAMLCRSSLPTWKRVVVWGAKEPLQFLSLVLNVYLRSPTSPSELCPWS